MVLAMDSEIALRELEALGDLVSHVNKDGILDPQVKTLLRRLTSDQLLTYADQDRQGPKLLTHICRNGNLDEVRYAIEQLHLGKIAFKHITISPHEDCPLVSVLLDGRPKVEIVRYLIEKGCPVSTCAFDAWLICRGTKNYLLELLRPLVHFGRRVLSEMLYLIGDPLHQRPGQESFVEAHRINNMQLLRENVKVIAEDVRVAVRCGYFCEVDDVSDDAVLNLDELADIYEIREVVRFNPRCQPELLYFRKSLELRKHRNDVAPFVCGRRALFTTIGELERLEAEIAAGDFVEVVWQTILAAARAMIPLGDLCRRIFRYVDDLGELLEMIRYIFEKWQLRKCTGFKFDLQFHLEELLTRVPTFNLLKLSQLYSLVQEVFGSDRGFWPNVGIKTALSRLDLSELKQQLDQIKHCQDEVLFMVAYSIEKPPAEPPVVTPPVQTLLMRLLMRDANVLTLRNYDSTINLLLDKFDPLPAWLKSALVCRVCCPYVLMSSEDRERWNINVSPFPNEPRPLRCLAARACSLERREILEEQLSDTYLRMVYAHPFWHG